MSGETPGAVRANNRARLLDPNSTAKTYNSNQTSVIDNRFVADGRRGNPPPHTVARPPSHTGSHRSADEYYGNAGSKPAKPGAKLVTAQRPNPSRQSSPVIDVTRDTVMVDLGETVAERLINGPVVLLVHDPKLMLAVRTTVDALVTREAISEDQYRDIRIIKADTAEKTQKAVPKVSTTTQKKPVKKTPAKKPVKKVSPAIKAPEPVFQDEVTDDIIEDAEEAEVRIPVADELDELIGLKSAEDTEDGVEVPGTYDDSPGDDLLDEDIPKAAPTRTSGGSRRKVAASK